MTDRPSKRIQTTIYSCMECKFCYMIRQFIADDTYERRHYCEADAGRHIKDKHCYGSFPKWCPLPDSQTGGGK